MSKLYSRIGMLLAILMLFVLAACAPAASPVTPAPPAAAPTTAATSAAPGQAPTVAATTAAPTQAATGAAGTLVMDADISDMISLDPAVSYEFSDDLIVHNVYETLVRFEGADLTTLKPGLATTWTTKDATDHWELTFNLRPDAKFASGNPVTADDVVYSFQRVLSLNKSPAFLFTDDAGMKADSVKAVDPHTVMINLPKTASPQGFLSILTFSVASVVDSQTVKQHVSNNDFGSGWLLDHSAGSGPYTIDHWTKESQVLLKANPNAATQPKLSAVLIKHVPEATNQLNELTRGDADIAHDLSPDQVATLKGKPNVTVATADSLIVIYVGMNVAVKPLDNPDVREALRTAVDYDGIINSLLSGNGKKLQTIIPAGLAGYNSDAPFQQDINAAKQLLSKGGQANGFSVDLLVPTGAAPGGVAWSDIAAKLQSDWSKIGVTINIKQTTQAELLGSYRAQKGQLVLILWGPDFPDPDANVTPFTDYASKSIAYRNSWNDAQIAKQAHDAALMTDTTQRTAAYKTLTESVLHNGPYDILYQVRQQFGLRSNVQGFAWSPIGWADFWTISK